MKMRCLRMTNPSAGSQAISGVPGAGNRVRFELLGLIGIMAIMGCLK